MEEDLIEQIRELATTWVNWISFSPCSEEQAADNARNNCGEELLELITTHVENKDQIRNSIDEFFEEIS